MNSWTKQTVKLGIKRTILPSEEVKLSRDTEDSKIPQVDPEFQLSLIQMEVANSIQKLEAYKKIAFPLVYSNIPTNIAKVNFDSLCRFLNETFNCDISKDFGAVSSEISLPDKFQVAPLEFESRLESGNLRLAIQLNEFEYDLMVSNDTNASRYGQWFFFKVNVKKKGRYKLNIINCEKQESLFNSGLKALKYSTNKQSWSRDTKNNVYYANGLSKGDVKLFTLSFEFESDEDELYFSYFFPYRFSDLSNFLSQYDEEEYANILRMESLGQSMAGNPIYNLIITNFKDSYDEIAERCAVILTSRVHPSESNSSFVIEAIIEFLLGDSPVAQGLRKAFVFKIVPMLNPDGVIAGNSRCSLIGKDLNRMWAETEYNCPSLLYVKNMILKTLGSRDIYLYCDFHGHSKKYNFFLYGVPPQKKLESKTECVFPSIFNGKFDCLDLNSCVYKVSAAKFKTARAVMKREFEINWSYCLETTFCGFNQGKYKDLFVTPAHMREIGIHFCEALFDMRVQRIFKQHLSIMQMKEPAKTSKTKTKGVKKAPTFKKKKSEKKK